MESGAGAGNPPPGPFGEPARSAAAERGTMNNLDNYWYRRLANRGVTRRRFIGGAAVTGVGALALGTVGCGDDDEDDAGGTPSGGTSPTTAAAAQPLKGGIGRFTSANNTWDTFDIDRS